MTETGEQILASSLLMVIDRSANADSRVATGHLANIWHHFEQAISTLRPQSASCFEDCVLASQGC